MYFLYPTFLFALFAIAIPIAIHLFNFRRFKKLDFTNVKFLQEVKRESSTRNKLKNLLLLLARILAIIFLVLAFAQPLVKKDGYKQSAANYAVSIYIDNSFSMQSQGEEGPLLNNAISTAEEIVQSYSASDKFQLVTNDLFGYQQRYLSKEEFISSLSEIQSSPTFVDLEVIQQRQFEAFERMENTNKVAYYISDFQEGFISTENIFDSTVLSNFVKLEPTINSNVFIDTAYFTSPVLFTNSSIDYVFSLRNLSESDLVNFPITLEINGNKKAVVNVNVQKDKTTTDTIRFQVQKTGFYNGVISFIDFPIVFDNQWYFSFQLAEEVNVLSIYEEKPNTFINAVFRSESYFKHVKKPVTGLNYANINTYNLICLEGISTINSGLLQELQRFCASGGSLLIYPSEKNAKENYNGLLSSLSIDVLDQRVENKRVVSVINTRNLLFKDVFYSVPKNAELPNANYGYSLSSRSNSNGDNILTLEDGTAFLTSYNLPKGAKVYLFTTPLIKAATDLVAQPLFVPLIYRMGFLSRPTEANQIFIGSNSNLSITNSKLKGDNIFRLKKGTIEVIPEYSVGSGSATLFFNNEIKDAGNYLLMAGSDSITNVSFNYNRLESVNQYLSESDLSEINAENGATIVSKTTEPIKQLLDNAVLGKQYWKLCLILALVALAMEIAIIKFWPVKST
jgi:hypothetical protein